MSAEHAEAHSHAAAEHAGAHHHPNYLRIWAILLLLLVVSVAGPMLGVLWITLVTAFGIAGVKAYLVAKNFMHIDMEKSFIAYMMVTVLVFVLLFFAGTAPDVMKDEGQRWVKPAWQHAEAAAAHEDGAVRH
jgi:caa(3)-type oxidase subunit IV